MKKANESKSKIIETDGPRKRQAQSVMRNIAYPGTMNASLNAINRADQIKTSHEGKRVGLTSKLRDGKPSAFGSRNYSVNI